MENRKRINYKSRYNSPIGNITLASDGKNLTGLWFEGQKYFGYTVNVKMAENKRKSQEIEEEGEEARQRRREPNKRGGEAREKKHFGEPFMKKAFKW